MSPLAQILAEFMARLPSADSVAVACSGGPDSMALALLAQEWAISREKRLVALIVDHGLRPVSKGEARETAARLKAHGMACKILAWQGEKPQRNVQALAREARYRLLTDYCRAHAIPALLLGHHLEDQAETFLLRLRRGSGVDGLAAMAAVTKLCGTLLLRPFLTIPKARLLSYLESRNQDYVTDPGNDNNAFERVRLRHLMPELAAFGFTPERLAKTAHAMARARAQLETDTRAFLAEAATFFPEGYVRLQHLRASEEIALRALATLVAAVGGGEKRPRLDELLRLKAALARPSFRGATLGGCQFIARTQEILLCREPGGLPAPQPIATGETSWDGRFRITLDDAPGTHLQVAPLTQAGWLSLSRAQNLRANVTPKRILYSLPSIRGHRGRILAVPQLGYRVDGIACEAVFAPPVLDAHPSFCTDDILADFP